jgi:hypothetical protein
MVAIRTVLGFGVADARPDSGSLSEIPFNFLGDASFLAQALDHELAIVGALLPQ